VDRDIYIYICVCVCVCLCVCVCPCVHVRVCASLLLFAREPTADVPTKLMLNQQKAPYKFSCVERRLNYFLAIFFVVLVTMAVVSAIFHDRWLDTEASFYPLMLGAPPEDGARFLYLLKISVTFLLLYNYVIPISLYVTLEMQKFMGALLVGWDTKLIAEDSDEGAVARTSGVCVAWGRADCVAV
jgi:phospholipid-translocating ATPase